MWQVIGQEKAVSLLRHGLEAGKLSHAYLVTGPEHVGKMTLALDLAKALNCEAADRPCQQCSSCVKIAARRHSDVQVIGLGKNEDSSENKLISIDQIRDIQHAASLPPFEGKHKVFIIDDAALLSPDAANCLLKTLEEPADKVTFILLTVNDKLLLPTVTSRCQRMELAPMPLAAETAALVARLNIEPERARLLAGLSHGCPEWAIVAANDDSLVQQHNDQFNDMLAVIGADYEERFAFSARLATQFAKDRGAVYGILNLWRDYWRDLILLKLDRPELITNSDRQAEMAASARAYGLGQVKDFINSIQSAETRLNLNANPRLVLDVLMLDIPLKEGDGVPVS
jgi:DNA polymerase III subunit delta'